MDHDALLTKPTVETIISVDIEANGPVPGINAMLSLGAAAYDWDGNELDGQQWNFQELLYSKPDPDTMAWWARQSPDVWAANRENAEPAPIAIRKFSDWVHKFPNPRLLAAPAAFDMSFIRYYVVRFIGDDKTWLNCIDLKSVNMGHFKDGYGPRHGDHQSDSMKRKIEEATGLIIKPRPHTHIALDDAREQVVYFFALVRGVAI